MGYLYIIVTVFFTVYGQLVLKWRIARYGSLPESFLDQIFFLLRLLSDAYILSGFLAAFFASLFWMAAMTKFDISFAYPFTSAAFVLVLVFAVVLFQEPLTWHKVVGVILIGAGIAVTGFSR